MNEQRPRGEAAENRTAVAEWESTFLERARKGRYRVAEELSLSEKEQPDPLRRPAGGWQRVP